MDTSRFNVDPYNPNNILITTQDIINIMKKLNINDFKIHNLSLYQQAFVQKSYCQMKDYEQYQKPDNCLPLFHKSYETLEFIGDSFLGNSVASYLYQRYVTTFNQDEGFLTKLKIRLVCGDQCTYYSKQLGFDKYMILSNHIEMNCNGRQNPKFMEDVFEAFIGAMFLDTNSYELVNEFIIRVIETHIDFTELIMKDNNYKDQILRYFQHNFKIHAKYEHISIEDDMKNNRSFTCNLLKNNEIICSGIGETKKKAEQDASKNALILYGLINQDVISE